LSKGTILHVIASLNVGGAETFLYRLCQALSSDGWQNLVIALSSDGPLRKDLELAGTQVLSPDWRTGGLPRMRDILALRRLSGQIHPNVIQGWMPHGNLAALLVRRWLPVSNVPVIWSVHQTLDVMGAEKPLTRLAIHAAAALSRQAEAIVYVSRVGQRQHEALGYATSRSVFVPNGVDTSFFAPVAEGRQKIRAEFGIPEAASVVGHLGRFHPQKDYRCLGAALARVLSSRDDVHVLIAGSRLDRNNEELLHELGPASEDPRVHLAGLRSDIPAMLSSMDLLCLSSAYAEAFPMVLLEAMACGVSCVATNVGDSADIVGEVGRIVPPRDPVALAEAILEELVLQTQTHTGSTTRGAVRRRVIENFTMSTSMSRYAKIYGDALRKR
jgi:glycosyltransferase involved in cell wall biosynthesis